MVRLIFKSKNNSKNVFFPVLTFDFNHAQSGETVNAGPNTLPAQKMIVAGAVGGCEFEPAGAERLESWNTVSA